MTVVDTNVVSARSRGCVPATRNVTDFEAYGLHVINPWAPGTNTP